MHYTSHRTQWTPALGSLVAFTLIAWIIGIYWLAIEDPLQCMFPISLAHGCPVDGAPFTEVFMIVFWTIATGGPLLAIGAWTFLAPEGRQFRAAYAVVAGLLLIVAPWLVHDASGYFAVDVIVTGIVPDFREVQTMLLGEVAGRLAPVVCAPLVMAVLMFRRRRWAYGLAWTAVTVNAAVAIAIVMAASVEGVPGAFTAVTG